MPPGGHGVRAPLKHSGLSVPDPQAPRGQTWELLPRRKLGVEPSTIHQLASLRPQASFIKGPERQDTESLASGQTFYSKSPEEELCWFPLCQRNTIPILQGHPINAQIRLTRILWNHYYCYTNSNHSNTCQRHAQHQDGKNVTDSMPIYPDDSPLRGDSTIIPIVQTRKLRPRIGPAQRHTNSKR